MTTDLCGEDVVVQLSSPQAISGDVDRPIEAAAIRGTAGSVELGRRLLLAARAGDTPAVLDLMAKGAPFTTDWLGTSPLHLAAANAHAATCAVLLRAGVSRDSRTKVERTPLHLAAAAGHGAVVALLLEHGAAVDCRDMLQMTPLHWAAARGQQEAARALLQHGADPRVRCKFRKTPRCLALRAARPDLAALLAAAEQEPVGVRGPDVKSPPKPRTQPEKKIIIESKTEPVPASAGVRRGAAGAGGGAGAAALLRAHGITFLPADRGSTVLSALRSGRTVVLSDAGKLMLKENSVGASEAQLITSDVEATPNVVSDANVVRVGSAGVAGVAGAAGVVRPTKLVSLNTRPLKRVVHPDDLQVGRVARAGRAARLRPALKIVLDKAHLARLLAAAHARRDAPAQASGAAEAGGGAGAEGEGSLRAQLQEARAAVASLGAELRACRARLAHYEGAQP